LTLTEAIAQQPIWLNWWLNWLLFGAFIAPVGLLIWRETRVAAVAALGAGVLSALSVGWMYNQMGYVKLLGLPHIFFWTPLAGYLIVLLRKDDVPIWPRRIVYVVLGTVLISLAFDYTDALRYALGDRVPLAMPPAG